VRFVVAKGALLLVALWMIGLVAVLVVRAPRPLDPTQAYAPCRRVTTEDGPPFFACSNGRAYLLQDGGWVDAGPYLMGPGVPQS
jgi:hypothetical protein